MSQTNQHGAVDPGNKPSALRTLWLPGLVLLASLLLVLLYARNAQQRELRLARAEFVAETDAMAEQLRQHLLNVELIARGGVSLFGSVDRPSASQWREYVRGLDIDAHYPALLGLGFAPSLDGLRLASVQRALQDNGQPALDVHPAGTRGRYGPVLYLEPARAENRSAVGYDMLSDPARRAAMTAAADQGDTQLTGPVHLVQDRGRSGWGFLMYLPVYRGMAPSDVAARRAALDGWVYVPLRMKTFVETALRGAVRDARVTISDAGDAAAGRLYSDATSGSEPLSRRSLSLDLYGRHWTLDFESSTQAGMLAWSESLRVTIAAGLIGSLLLFAVALSLARTEAVAQDKARRMSESFARSEQRFRNALRYSAVGAALLDRHGRIVEANPALAEIFDRTASDLVGTMFTAHLVDGSEESLRTREMQALSDGVHRSIRHLRRDDGSVRELQLVHTPVPGDDDHDFASLLQVEDVTERLRARAREQALNRTLEARVALRTRELTHANQELESFAYSVSHDLRTPLRTIDGFSRLLVERHGERIDDEGKDYLSRVRAAAGRMDELIEALLRMSRVSRGQLTLVPLDLSAMAQEIVDELRRAQPAREVEIDIAPGLQAVGDAALIRNLLENLLGNAWKFTSDNKVACVRFDREPDAPDHHDRAFFVRDNGAGFDQAYADKLFRPFQRLHSQQEFPGNGIGLASVKRIVERHGGTIRAAGKVGEGATFVFTLPGDARGI